MTPDKIKHRAPGFGPLVGAWVHDGGSRGTRYHVVSWHHEKAGTYQTACNGSRLRSASAVSIPDDDPVAAGHACKLCRKAVNR